MPVALATAATLKSISAHRITNVSPTAMMPVTLICCRMLPRLSIVRKLGLTAPNSTTSTSSVANGAMLRSWLRSQEFIGKSPSCGGEQAVLADHLAGEFLGDTAALHHQDAVGHRQHRLRL